MHAHHEERAESRRQGIVERPLLDRDPRHRLGGQVRDAPARLLLLLRAGDGVPLHQPGLQGSLEEAGEPRPVPVDGCATEGPARGRLAPLEIIQHPLELGWRDRTQPMVAQQRHQPGDFRADGLVRPPALELRPWQVRVLRYWRNVTRVAAWAASTWACSRA